MLIIRRVNCINMTSGIFQLCKLQELNLVRDHIRDILGGQLGKYTFGTTDYQFRTSSERIPVSIGYTGTMGMVGNSRLSFYDSICHAKGFGLFLAKDSDRIAALTPSKQTFLSTFRP